MSTAYSPSPDPEKTPGDSTGARVAETPDERGSTARETKPPFIQRVPGPVFTTAYGALLVGVVVMGVLLVSNESDAEEPPAAVDRPSRPLLPPPAHQDNVESSLRPGLIADAETARTPTGVTVTGTMTAEAEADTGAFAGHVSRLLEQNCVDNMTVTTQDNMVINLWGFCYTAPPAATLKSYVDTALDDGAQEVSFYFLPGRKDDRTAWITWSSDSQDTADRTADGFEDIPLEDGIGRLELVSYGPDSVHHYIRTPKGFSGIDAPTGEKFKEKYGIPTPALPRPR